MSLTPRPGCPLKMGGERNSKIVVVIWKIRERKKSEEELVNVRRTFGSNLLLRQSQLCQ